MHRKQRQVENEAVFREANERVQHELKELTQTAVDHGHADILEKGDLDLHFMCECSNEECKERIMLSYNTYTSLHRNRRHFLIKPGHDTPAIEKIVAKTPEYSIVEKLKGVTENPAHLHKT